MNFKIGTVLRAALAIAAACFHGCLFAFSCNSSGSLALELARQDMRPAPLNPQGSFTQDMNQALAQMELKSRCTMLSTEAYVDVMTERVEAWGGHGYLQRNGEDGTHSMLREGYFSLRPSSTLFIDIGKKDIRNGQLFFVSPLDLLQRPANFSGRGYLKAQGVSWRDLYREGSVLLSGTLFTDHGNIELAIIPKLASKPKYLGLNEYRTLQRTNPANQLYLAYGSNYFEDFNPRLVALFGDGISIGLGASGFLTDDFIFTSEASIKNKSNLTEITSNNAQGIYQAKFPQAENVFSKQTKDNFFQLATGIRYTTKNSVNISVEYLFQNQGFTSKQRSNYFNFLDSTENLYQKYKAEFLRGYALIYAQESDNWSRHDVMMGKNYLMAHIQRSPQSSRGVGFESATIFNLDDKSYSLNVHLFSQINRNFQIYLGAGYLGGERRSEFGRFGNDGVSYAGIRAIW